MKSATVVTGLDKSTSMSKIPFRLRASLIHLACSALVAAFAMAVIFFIWHPGAIAPLQGISQLVIVLIAVDVVLGPLMTLILFTPHKAHHLLKLDLGIIASLQITALLYGLFSIFMARPVYVVFNIDRFTIVTAGEIVQESLARTQDPHFQRLPLGQPQVIASQLPRDKDARSDLIFYTLETGNDIQQLPEYFVPYTDGQQQAIAKARPLTNLKTHNEMDDTSWQAFLHSLSKPSDQLAYLPVDANSRDGVAIIDARSGSFVQLVNLLPGW